MLACLKCARKRRDFTSLLCLNIRLAGKLKIAVRHHTRKSLRAFQVEDPEAAPDLAPETLPLPHALEDDLTGFEVFCDVARKVDIVGVEKQDGTSRGQVKLR